MAGHWAARSSGEQRGPSIPLKQACPQQRRLPARRKYHIPLSRGLVQAFSVYIDTLFVCTATGIIMILTNVFNCVGESGEYLIQSSILGENADPGAPWVQAAIGTVFSWGPGFISIALVFFAFTTCMNQMYNCESTLTFFFKGTTPKWATMGLRILFLAFVVYAGVIESTTAWAFGDVGIGLITWGNMIFLITCLPIARKLLLDFEEQKKSRGRIRSLIRTSSTGLAPKPGGASVTDICQENCQVILTFYQRKNSRINGAGLPTGSSAFQKGEHKNDANE